MKFLQKTILFGSGFMASSVQAHSGHGNTANGAAHYLIEPLHLITIGAIVLGFSGILFLLRRLRRQHR